MKNCLKKEELFDYYNQEIENNHMIEIKNHINECEMCRKELKNLEMDVALLKISLDILNPDVEKVKFKSFTKPNANKIVYSKILSWAAGITLLFTVSTITFIKFIHNQKPVNDYEYFEYIPDMNDAWKENSITVTSYDRKGNPINHQVIKD